MAFMLRSEGKDGGKRPLLPAGRRHMTCFGRCTCWELQFRRVGRCRRAASSLLLKSMWTRHGMGPSERQDDDEQMLCWVLIIWPSVGAFDAGSGWSVSSSASLSLSRPTFRNKQWQVGRAQCTKLCTFHGIGISLYQDQGLCFGSLLLRSSDAKDGLS